MGVSASAIMSRVCGVAAGEEASETGFEFEPRAVAFAAVIGDW